MKEQALEVLESREEGSVLHTTGQVGCQGCTGEWSSAQTPPPSALATHLLCFQVPCKQSGKDAPCTFRYLKPSMRYCVRTVAAGMAKEQSREAEQCVVTPAGPAGGSSLASSAAVVASQVLLAAQTCVEVWVTNPPAILVSVGGPVRPCGDFSWGDAVSSSALGLCRLSSLSIPACRRGSGEVLA